MAENFASREGKIKKDVDSIAPKTNRNKKVDLRPAELKELKDAGDNKTTKKSSGKKIKFSLFWRKKQKNENQKTEVKKNINQKISGKLESLRSKIGSALLKVFIATFLAVLFGAITFAGAAFAYQDNFKDRALYGTKVFGQDMGGLSEREVLAQVKKSLDSITFKFLINGEEIVASPEDIGIEYKVIETAANAFRVGRGEDYVAELANSSVSLIYLINKDLGKWLAREIELPIYQNAEVVYTVNDEKLDDYAKSISVKYNSESKDAGLVISGEEVQVIPAVYGRAVATESIRAQIKEALKTNSSPVISINMTEIKPDILETDVSESIAAAKAIIGLPVKYTYGNKNFVPTKENIGSWIVFKKEGEALRPYVDTARVTKYLDQISADINIPATNRKVRVVNQGQPELIQEGKNGLAVDVRSAATKTANNLNSGAAVNIELTTYLVKYKTEVNNVLVANWDKYIDVDISLQQMCAYLAGGEKVNCWAITTGRSGWNTPIGTFLIRRKSGAGGIDGGPGGGGVCMPNPPSTTPLCGINYVSTFTAQGHAIHEAWWRRQPGDANYFGNPNWRWNGSHGCVNAPYDVAKFIYYWAPIGTPVVIHY